MASRFKSSDKIRKMVLLAVLTALIPILSYIPIKFGPFSVTLTLPIIVIGAALCGKWGGAWLGGVFGIMVFITGDAAAFWAINPFATVLVVMLKGIAAGFVAGLLYQILSKKLRSDGIIAASVAAPVVNTGIFILGCLLFFFKTVSSWGLSGGFTNGFTYIIVGMVGMNFVVEFIINILLTPVLIRLLDIVTKKRYA